MGANGFMLNKDVIGDTARPSHAWVEAYKPTPRCKPSDVITQRPRIEGKFFYVGDEKLWIRGVTYGTFACDEEGRECHKPEVVNRDFADIAAHGLNAVRTYTVPPAWFLDTALHYGIRVLVGLPWQQHVTFLDDQKQIEDIEGRIRAGVRACTGHPAVLAYAIGNEIPASIVRWHGHCRVEQHLERLYQVAKEEDPTALVTYVNFPSTEYLQLTCFDFVCFNVYLESQPSLDAYLARLQNIAGDRPLVMGEVGLDSRRNGEAAQARVLDWQVRTAFAAGCSGAFVFSWTDEWYRGGCAIQDWDFGLTTRDRKPKLALSVVQDAFRDVPFADDRYAWPRVSVVVCSYNGSRTIRTCLEHVVRLDYPNYEIIVVDDGSTDATPRIALEYGARLISTDNHGLSSARNTGMEAASGEIVAYIDDDAYPDQHWLTYLARTFMTTKYVGVGGPNLPPRGDGPIADCVANAPGGPIHVLLSDREAEHIPGCNMAFRKANLQAIGGFDPQFRTAGDDVDVCWRLQQRGWVLGFNPAAMVWHHRRNSVGAYWRQQRGYGRAEAMLEKKWPEKYNRTGHLSWSGRLYGKGLLHTLGRVRRIYHGTWGSAPFQSLYEPAPGLLKSLPLMPEWYLLIAALAVVSILGVFWKPLLWALPVLGCLVGTSFLQASHGAAKAVFTSATRSRRDFWMWRMLTACLHVMQPLARLCGRLRHGLSPWRRRSVCRSTLPTPRTITVWSERWRCPFARLESIESRLRPHRAPVLRGKDEDPWDLEVHHGMWGAVRLLMVVEEHGSGKQLLRFRLWPRCSTWGVVLLAIFGALSIAAWLDSAWLPSAILGASSMFFCFRLLQECGSAMAVLLHTLSNLHGEDA
jgi:glycosyltransferase involved in cell wall biosynthesis